MKKVIKFLPSKDDQSFRYVEMFLKSSIIVNVKGLLNREFICNLFQFTIGDVHP